MKIKPFMEKQLAQGMAPAVLTSKVISDLLEQENAKDTEFCRRTGLPGKANR